MYVFASALFFLAFFSLDPNLRIGEGKMGGYYKQRLAKLEKIDRLDSLQADAKDSTVKSALSLQKQDYQLQIEKMDSIFLAGSRTKEKRRDSTDDANDEMAYTISTAADTINTVEQYEAQQAALPENKRAGWFEHMVVRKQVQLKSQYRFHMDEYNKLLLEKFFHTLPQMFFVSLPLFAFILFLLYIRRKEYYYTDHAIFSVYHFTAVFVMGLFIVGFRKLATLPHMDWIDYLSRAIFLYAVFYLYKSMRNFYGQRRGKTIAKFLLLCFISGILTSLLAVLFLLITFFKN